MGDDDICAMVEVKSGRILTLGDGHEDDLGVESSPKDGSEVGRLGGKRLERSTKWRSRSGQRPPDPKLIRVLIAH